MQPVSLVCLIIAFVAVFFYWKERCRADRLFKWSKELELERQGLIDAGRYVLSIGRRVPEGYEADVEPFMALSRALQNKLRAEWRIYYAQHDGCDITPDLIEDMDVAERGVADTKRFLVEKLVRE